MAMAVVVGASSIAARCKKSDLKTFQSTNRRDLCRGKIFFRRRAGVDREGSDMFGSSASGRAVAGHATGRVKPEGLED